MLEWQMWDGQRWKELELAQVEVDRGEVAFVGPLKFEPTTVNHVEGLWLRARLAEVPESASDTELDTVRSRVEVVGEGVWPTKAYANLDNNAFLPLDLGKNIYPFGKDPKVDSTLYLVCDELLATADAYVGVEMQLADALIIPKPNPSESLVLAVEYWDGKRWRQIGRTSTRGGLPGTGDELGFHDGTKALSESGRITFRRPRDMETVELNGETQPLVADPRREGRLRRAGHLHLGERQVDLQG
ncbi:MAG: hypothetical protein HC863_00910 [Myxococcales bacterium]|nr:hypothetical protein [Myxococcales bacterium]